MKRRFCCCLLLVCAFSFPAWALEWNPGRARTPDAGAAVQSDDALAFLQLDIENNPGWVTTFKAGVQWKLFRNVGHTASASGISQSVDRNHTRAGGSGTVGLGYNFGERLPLTIGLQFGLGPQGKFDTASLFSNGTDTYSIWTRQKIRTYDFDVSIDYDFLKCSRWTPFVGVSGGIAYTRTQGWATVENLATNAVELGESDWKNRVNFIGGARAGVKFAINPRVTLSLYGSYTYVGSIRERQFNGVTSVDLRTRKAKVHELDLKAGIKISF